MGPVRSRFYSELEEFRRGGFCLSSVVAKIEKLTYAHDFTLTSIEIRAGCRSIQIEGVLLNQNWLHQPLKFTPQS